MKEQFLYEEITFDLFRSGRGNRIAYILVPRGLIGEIQEWSETASETYGTSIVLVRGMDWNNDLTPWPAPGVFRKAKPFEGNATEFLRKFSGTMVPWFESQTGLATQEEDGRTENEGHVIRTLAGISLSGLFSLWAGFGCGTFEEIAAISGSFWYDGFAQWTEERKLHPGVGRIYISLGDREKRSKDPRMSMVEECTGRIIDALRGQVQVEYVLEADTTHFSPIIPRLERMFLYLQDSQR